MTCYYSLLERICTHRKGKRTELEDTNMKKTTAQKAATYRLPETTTPENLEMKLMNNLGTILTFGDHILAAGYFYDPNGRSYYGAVYRFTTGDHTCEGDIKLVGISDETFIDNGHAIAWAMTKAN